MNDYKYLPTKFVLFQNYPNPFNSTTKIKFTVPDFARVKLKLYDIMGREIKTLMDDYKNPSEYVIAFDATSCSLSLGVYFYVLSSRNFLDAKPMVLLK